MDHHETGLGVADTVAVALVDCATEVRIILRTWDLSAREASPVRAAMAATLAQTGCDPPPVVTRG